MKTATVKRQRIKICQVCWYEKWAPENYFPDDYGKGYDYDDCYICGDSGIVTSIWANQADIDEMKEGVDSV